ncbi:MAG TPA: alginate lyase family protein [Polyangia bacterium]
MKFRAFGLCALVSTSVNCSTASPPAQAPAASLMAAAPVASARFRSAGFWDFDGLAAVRARAKAGDPSVRPAVDKALRAADKWLEQGPWSVLDKTKVAVSADKRDYMSLASYWWPNPQTPDGVPYVRKDGLVNPERATNAFDYASMNKMADAVSALALAHHLSDDPKYAAHAARILKTWFLDPATGMRPNLLYAQAVPGVATGRAEGVLDGVLLARMLDGVELLSGAPSWSAADEAALRAWFGQLLDWLRSHENALKEERARNNHGTWYDVQVVRYALFVDRPDLARSVVEAAKQRRIAAQIAPDGSQPEELERTKTFDYSMYNLRALFDLATLGRSLGVDLFAYVSPDGRGIRRAFEYMLPYADPAKTWPGKQIAPFKHTDFIAVLRRAAVAYREPAYEAVLKRHFADELPKHQVQLVHPEGAEHHAAN